MVRGFSARLCFPDFEPPSFADFTAILGAFYVSTVNSQLIKLKLKCAKRDRVRRNKKQFSLRKEKL